MGTKSCLLQLLLLWLCGSHLHAQQPPIIYFAPLAQANIGKNINTALFVPTDLSKIPQVQEGANRLYDFSKLEVKPVQNGSPTEAYTSRAFPNATHITRNVKDYLNLFSYIFVNEIQSLTNNQYASIGLRIPKANFSLGLETGNSNDSLNFPEQAIVFSQPFKKMVFPCTQNSVIHPQSTIYRDMRATVYYNVLGIIKETLTKRVYETRSDSVVGWGKLRLPTLNRDLDVLMVKEYTTLIDSFLYKDKVSTARLVYGLGALQGKVTRASKILFYTPAALLPVLKLNFAEHDFKILVGAVFDVGLLVTGTNEVAIANNFRIYPNPIAQKGILSIEYDGEKSNQLEIFDITGKLVKSIDIPLSGHYMFPLTNDVQKGLYLLKMNESVKKLMVE
jgi:hypothetical protein